MSECVQGRRSWIGFCVALLTGCVLSTVNAEELVSPVPDAKVARAVFTSGIENREPVDELANVSADLSEVYFFTDLRGLEGRTVTHRWELEGETVAEVSFQIGGPRWRVYSKKSLGPGLKGDWTVVVVDESGWPVDAAMFRYSPVSAPVAPDSVPVPETGASVSTPVSETGSPESVSGADTASSTSTPEPAAGESAASVGEASVEISEDSGAAGASNGEDSEGN